MPEKNKRSPASEWWQILADLFTPNLEKKKKRSASKRAPARPGILEQAFSGVVGGVIGALSAPVIHTVAMVWPDDDEETPSLLKGKVTAVYGQVYGLASLVAGVMAASGGTASYPLLGLTINPAVLPLVALVGTSLAYGGSRGAGLGLRYGAAVWQDIPTLLGMDRNGSRKLLQKYEQKTGQQLTKQTAPLALKGPEMEGQRRDLEDALKQEQESLERLKKEEKRLLKFKHISASAERLAVQKGRLQEYWQEIESKKKVIEEKAITPAFKGYQESAEVLHKKAKAIYERDMKLIESWEKNPNRLN